MQKRVETGFWRYSFIFGILCCLFVARLAFLQCINHTEYTKKAEKALALTVEQSAPRGEITDRYGRPIVTNRPGYFVVLAQQTEDRHRQNRTVLKVLALTSQGVNENTPKSEEPRLSKTYSIDQSYTEAEKQLLLNVYYQIEQADNTPYATLAEDVDFSVVSAIEEQKEAFYGVFVEERPVRHYLYPNACAHILGRVGKINQKEYEALQAQGYQKTDTLGKQGAEKAFEQDLRGTKGVACAPKYKGGAGEQFVEEIAPKSGNTVMLTIDLELQLAAEQALERGVQSAKKQKGGAAVVLSCHTGEILAAASYPTYSVETFHKDYPSLVENQAKPLFHRAFSGLYEPGSTIKPITAIAALEEKVLTPKETIQTTGEYHFKNSTFRCNIFRTKGENHGKIDVSEALAVSCNYFFYDLAVRLGIEPIAQAERAFGLGESPGSELVLEEAKGVVATPKYRKNKGNIWYPGDTLQAAIGQSDNRFSPLALANYAATLANGGTRYRTTLLKGIQSAETGEMIKHASPEVKGIVSMTPQTKSVVKDGMIGVTEQGGTAETVFSDFPVSVAGKTGSAQVPGGTNGLFICYAPAQNPQIAVSVVLEHGDSGTKAAQVAKEILLSYFKTTKETKQISEEVPYTLLP